VFAKLRKATMNFVMCAFSSVCQNFRSKTRIFIFRYFSNIYQENSNFI